MKLIKVFSLFVLTLIVLLFGVSAQKASEDLTGKVIGCYSAGDRAVTVMRITKDYIQTKHGKQRIPYKVIEVDPKSDTILFELLEKDRSNFLQPFVSIIYNSDDEVIERSFISTEDYRNNNPSSRLRFVRDKCSVVKSFLK